MIKTLISILIAASSLVAFAASPGVIVFPRKPFFKLNDHMMFFMRTIPLSMYSVDGGTVRIAGEIELDLTGVKPDMAGQISAELQKGKTGELSISGALVDLTQLKLTYTKAPSYDPIEGPPPADESMARVVYAPPPPQVEREPTPLERAQAMSDLGMGCGAFLIDVDR